VRRITLLALDGAKQPVDVFQPSDRVALKPGARVLLFAAESSTGVVTLREFNVTAQAGEELVALPAKDENGTLYVKLCRGL